MPVPTVLLFLKAPVPGFVKTRLARAIGDSQACLVYRALVERQIDALPPGWPLEIHFTPSDAEPVFRDWIHGAERYLPQVEADLGTRLTAAAAGVLERKEGPAFLIGGDCPDLDAETFYAALAALAQGNDAVFGPARDGGFYLLALKRFDAALFQGIPWGTSRVLDRSRHQAERAGLKALLLNEKEDIDDLASLRRCRIEAVSP